MIPRGRWDLAFAAALVALFVAGVASPDPVALMAGLTGLAPVSWGAFAGVDSVAAHGGSGLAWLRLSGLGMALALLGVALVGAGRRDPQEGPRSFSRALVVDDCATHRLVLTHKLTALGVRVVMARDGQEALDRLARQSFDAVFLDWCMPVMGGEETLRHIRAREGRGPRQLVVVVTNRSPPRGRAQILAAGADEYLTKPLSGPRLNRFLEHWFAEWRPAFAADVADALEPGGEEPSLDPFTLVDLGEPSLAALSQAELTAVFEADVVPAVLGLAEAVDAQDPVGVQRCAHKICGGAGAVGAYRLARLARLLERAGREGDITGAGAMLEALQVEWAEVLEHSRERLGPTAGQSTS